MPYISLNLWLESILVIYIYIYDIYAIVLIYSLMEQPNHVNGFAG